MAGTVLSYPLNGAANWQDFPSIVQKMQAGFNRITLTNFENDDEPKIAAGSTVDVNGQVAVFLADESISGWAGISVGSEAYIKITISGSSAMAVFTTMAPTYSASKRGYYDGNDRFVGGVHKAAAGSYVCKWLYQDGAEIKGRTKLLSRVLSLDGHPPIKAILGDPVTLSGNVARGQPILALHQHWGTGSDYVLKEAGVVLQPWNNQSYYPRMAYLGKNFWACTISEIGATYYSRLRIYEHVWGSTAWTQCGSTLTVWSGASNFKHCLAIGFLQNHSGTEIDFFLLQTLTTGTPDSWLLTYRFRTSDYNIAQVGSAVALGFGSCGTSNTICRAFKDKANWLWMITAASVGTPSIRVYEHDGSGNYTLRGTPQAVDSGAGNFYAFGMMDPIKMGTDLYRFIGADASIVYRGGWVIEYDISTYTYTVIKRDLWWQLENTSLQTKGPNPGIGTDVHNQVHATPAGPFSLVAGINVGASGGGGRWEIDSIGIDLISAYFFRRDKLVVSAAESNVGNGQRFLIEKLHNGLYAWTAPMDCYYSSASHVDQMAGIVQVRDGKIRPVAFWMEYNAQVSINAGPAWWDHSHDGRLAFSLQDDNAGKERFHMYYVPRLLGFTDRDHLAGDVVRPVIRGVIDGLSGLKAGCEYGWSIYEGKIHPHSGELIPVGRSLASDVLEVDTPIDDFGYKAIDER